MASLKLTARTVVSIKPKQKRAAYFDSKVSGLVLRVTPAGGKSWAVLYRHRRRLRWLTLGSASVISLAEARRRAKSHLSSASDGADPAAEKQFGRKVEDVEDLAELYIDKWAKPKKRSWRQDRNLLDNKILPRWRHRAIQDISRRDVRELVERVAETAPVVANRVAALLSKLFAFALDRDLVQVSPAVRIPRPGQEHQRDRVLSEAELRSLWQSFDGLELQMGAFYKLRALTAQRGGEVATMRWQDVDLEGAWWRIPSASSKNKLAHRVPLSPATVTLLAALQPKKEDPEAYVLAGARGKRQQAAAAAAFTVEDFRGHDLRRTAASYMSAGGVPRLTISKILNHAERGVTAVYDRHSYDPEKRAALDWWSVKLEAIIKSKDDGARVLPFAARA